MIRMDVKPQLNTLVTAKAARSETISDRKVSPEVKASASERKTSGDKFKDLISEDDIKTPNEESQVVDSPEADSHQSTSSVSSDVNSYENPDSEENKNRTAAATKQAVMNVFFEKMQTEVGVSPNQIMEAFAKLSVSELVGPPEESAEKVIEQLNLQGIEKEKAHGLYNEMLALTAAVGMSQYLGKNENQADIAVLNKDQARRKALDESLLKMSDRFFMTGAEQNPRIMAGADMGRGIEAYQRFESSEKNQNQNQSPLTLTVAGTQVPIESASLGSDSVIANPSSSTGTTDLFGMQSTNTEMQTPDFTNLKASSLSSTSEMQGFGSELETLNSDLPVVENNSSASASKSQIMNTTGPNLNGFVSPTDIPTDVEVQSLDAFEGPLGQEGEKLEGLAGSVNSELTTDVSKDKDSDLEGDGQNEDLKSQMHVNSQEAHKSTKAKSEFIVGAPKATEAEVQSNVKELISQAQFLVKKGGGEMKVALNPEGLGEVNLKVSMNNGQVNVEMVTGSEEAKKIIEKGLGELRDNLAMHKMHLDSIKIENSKELSNQLANHQQDLERGYQQKFLNDFKERNQNMRGEMYGLPGPRVPGSQTKDQAANLIYANQKRKDSSRRLDLVA